ncbi:hypothetical protein CWI84_10350 [Idiomarina tyrosinivorans]|uniref:Uncharacterized protein n=1 Tax=Idiomarina tyrosinivorans TaxID=1445662 RepID=A0A432ZM35_9GAMM|nr:hypothetical protein CWI84_10350 [Idiomarina tyrosinivorans]
MFIAYDSNVYSIAKSAGIVIGRESDIHFLNQLQFLNCRANILPGQEYDGQALSEGFQACKSNRLNERHVLHYAVLDGVEGEHKRYRVIDSPDDEDHKEAFVHSQTLFPSMTRWSLLLRWRNKGFGMVNGTGVGCVRRSYIEEHRGPPFNKMYTRR